MAQRKDKPIDKTVRDRLSTYEERRQAYDSQLAKKKRFNFIILTSMVAVIVLALAGGIVALVPNPPQSSEVDPVGSPTNAANVPDPALSENRTWTGAMTVGGVPLTFDLDGAAAPQGVASTIHLIDSGFYEGLSCHRITTVESFVLQCGDPNADGSGSAGYYYGPVENSPADDYYPAGTIAVFRHPNNATSMGSQFLIFYKDGVLPVDTEGGYTVIGHITGGLEQLASQVGGAGTADGSTDGPPAMPVTLTELSVQ